ncbi:S-layer homology domain-containing protein [Cohnella nanjingensis]|uniref:S-layer homology domain-containing protein n=1 Tax=Cohnella nanjingensis TaxID=1387779 RepID=A0A7X0VEU7_9BACL|nr:S-layer homology domain-containing protein [Cohnella nanjingensis]MBB6670613.1 S-layer homology domain-containing protein [Cohnella nanjingensis]
MKKRLVSLVLAIAVVMSYAVSAFAATPTDVAGNKNQTAIEELVALGVINGYTDGTFKPENKITRAELAKIVVEVTGFGKTAEALKNVKSKFTDVKVNEWYTGYINVAETKGYILGDKDKNGKVTKFRPNDNIKFEEVTAIILRAIGYQDAHLSGNWPYNVVVKADDIGLFSKVDIAQGTLASRGVVSQIVNNGLLKQMVAWDPEKANFVNVKDPNNNNVFLISKLGTTEWAVVTANSLDAQGKIELNGTRQVTASNFIVTGGAKLADLLGHRVLVLKTNDAKVLAVSDLISADNVVTGKLNASVTKTTYAIDNGLEVKVGSDVLKFNLTASTQLFSNTNTVYSIAKDADVTVYLTNIVVTNDYGDKTSKQVVLSVVANTFGYQNVKLESTVAATSTAKARVITGRGAVDVTDATVITINGETKTFADLAKNDILNVAFNTDKVATVINATRNVVEGKIDAVRTTTEAKYYTVNGVEYKEVNSLGLLPEATYKLFLNADKNVAAAELVVPGSAGNVAVILSIKDHAQIVENGILTNTFKDVVTYYSLKDDKVLSLNLDDKTYADQDAADLDEKKAVIEWKTDNSGNVTGIKTAVALSSAGTVSDKSDSSFKKGGSTYYINANTLVYDATKASEATKSDRKVSKSDLTKLANGAEVAVYASGAYAQYVFVTKSSTGDDLKAAFGTYNDAYTSVSTSGTVYTVELNVNGKATGFKVTQAVYDAAKAHKTADHELVALFGGKDAFDGIEFPGAKTATHLHSIWSDKITAVSQGTNSLTVDGDASNYIINATDTVVYLQAKDNTVTVGNLYDLDDYFYKNAADYDVIVASFSKDYSVADKPVAKAIVLKLK